MAKPRKLKKVSERLTKILAIDELKAIGGDEYDIQAMSPDTAVPQCIECNGQVENHGRFCRTLRDIITIDGKKRFAKLHYYFYKYRCLNDECGAVFQKTVHFVKENAKITKRYENEVLWHMMYESIDDVRRDMSAYLVEGHENDVISKPAMAKLIKRWVSEKDSRRRFVTPAGLLLFTYKSFFNSFVLICDITQEPCSIVEVLPAISESLLKEFFSKMDMVALRGIIIDCDPVVNATVRELFPRKKIMVDMDSIQYVLREEFREYLYIRLKKYQKYVRENFLKDPVEVLPEDSAKLYKLRKNDPILNRVCSKYSVLYSLLKNHRDVTEVQKWASTLDGEIEDIFILTKSYIEEYGKEIAYFYKQRTPAYDGIYDKLYGLCEKMEHYFSACTDHVFRSRILYSDFRELEGREAWRGMNVDVLSGILDQMISAGGLKKHERK
ncbi:MAG: transposase [Hespellia sp.]|nr:transposase [Hespellia sp.]